MSTELRHLQTFAALPVDVQRAASRLAGDMSLQTGQDETLAVLSAVVTAWKEREHE